MNRNLRIVFMGTPDFAVPSLAILIQNKYNVVGLITAPDKPAGRGQQIQTSAVKKYAIENGLTILQPEKLKSPDFIEELKKLHANLFVVVAFRMLPDVVWQMPQFGTFNLHASLLPDYRGAAPINWAVINGEKETGVSTFFLQHDIDTGNIILQDKIDIGTEDNAGIVHDKLMQIGSNLVLNTVRAIENNTAVAHPQTPDDNTNTTKHAPKIFKETCLIDWNKPAIEIHNLIRGLAPFPTAYTYLNGKLLKIFAANVVEDAFFQSTTNLTYTPKTIENAAFLNIITDNNTFLHIQCKDNYLNIKELQIEGKRKMNVSEFLKGYKF